VGWLRDVSSAAADGAVALLCLLAIVVIAVGVINYLRIRGREQVVIANIGAASPESAEELVRASALSPWLRQTVRAALLNQSHDARHIVDTMLGQDGGTAHRPLGFSMDYAEAAIAGAANDALAAISQGLRVLTPSRADSAVSLLRTLAPPRRGYQVSSWPIVLGSGDDLRIGISVEISRLDGPPIGLITFWSPSNDAATPHERFMALIEPAAWWVALRLLSLRLRIHRPGSRIRRSAPKQTEAGFRSLFAGGLGRTAMDKFEPHAYQFGEDALFELEAAAAALDFYHRPPEMLATVLESLARTSLRDGAKENSSQYFNRSLRYWRQAESKLMSNPAVVSSLADDDEIRDYKERMRLRRMKCQLFADDENGAALVADELAHDPLELPSSARMRTLYNAACLYASLGSEWVPEAKNALGRAVLIEPQHNVRNVALHDDELRCLPDLDLFLRLVARIRPANRVPVMDPEASERLAALL
jgi:hypothetical protein